VVERLARQEPILALSARADGWPAEHPAAADLDLLRSRPPGVVVASRSALRIWIVLGGCPPAVRAAAGRLMAGPLPVGVSRIRLR
jgi:hypothetical protein